VKATRSLGTPLFMSPEQIQGDGAIGPKADLYALGHIAFALLVGEAYWETDARESEAVFPLLATIVRGATEVASLRARGATLPAGFDAWFAKATSSRPSQRFESAGAQIEALAIALEDLASHPPPLVKATVASAGVTPAPVSDDRLSATPTDAETRPIPRPPRVAPAGKLLDPRNTNEPVSSDPQRRSPAIARRAPVWAFVSAVALAAVATAFYLRRSSHVADMPPASPDPIGPTAKVAVEPPQAPVIEAIPGATAVLDPVESSRPAAPADARPQGKQHPSRPAPSASPAAQAPPPPSPPTPKTSSPDDLLKVP
jgi:eukaryotic-like serine/threonine-protein kinase